MAVYLFVSAVLFTFFVACGFQLGESATGALSWPLWATLFIAALLAALAMVTARAMGRSE